MRDLAVKNVSKYFFFCFFAAKLLSSHRNPLDSEEIHMVSKATSGYSGSDLTSLAKEAALGPIREVSASQLLLVRQEQLRKIGLQDFEGALHKIRPSVSKDSLIAYRDWNAKYGDIS